MDKEEFRLIIGTLLVNDITSWHRRCGLCLLGTIISSILSVGVSIINPVWDMNGLQWVFITLTMGFLVGFQWCLNKTRELIKQFDDVMNDRCQWDTIEAEECEAIGLTIKKKKED